jgi:hypothetical protein
MGKLQQIKDKKIKDCINNQLKQRSEISDRMSNVSFDLDKPSYKTIKGNINKIVMDNLNIIEYDWLTPDPRYQIGYTAMFFNLAPSYRYAWRDIFDVAHCLVDDSTVSAESLNSIVQFINKYSSDVVCI